TRSGAGFCVTNLATIYRMDGDGVRSEPAPLKAKGAAPGQREFSGVPRILTNGVTDLALLWIGCRYSRSQGANGAAEVPELVVDVYGGHVVAGEGHVFVAADLNDEAFAGHYLIEMLAVFKGDGNDLVAHAGFALAFEMIGEFTGDGNQTRSHEVYPDGEICSVPSVRGVSHGSPCRQKTSQQAQ